MITPKKRVGIVVALITAGLVIFFLFQFVFRSPFRYAGTLEATRVDLSARVATTITAVQVQEGQKIRKGDKLVSLACEDIRIAARLANENFERGQKLYRTGSMSKESYDQVVNRKQDSDARLSWCEIEAPISGTVMTRFHEPGEWVNPGTKILATADIQDIWAYIYVPQAIMSRLKTGMALKGIVPELGKREFTGTIRKINEEAEFTPKNVQTQAERTRLVFGIKIAFENRDETLKPGMTIEVTLPSEVTHDL